MNVDGACILVTGAASGLGAATARHLAARGARVVAFDLAADAVGGLAAELGAKAAVGDVTDPEAVAAGLEAAVDCGPLRAVVNCAGIGTAARIVGRDGPMPLDAFERVIRVNLIGTFNVMRLAAARMAGNPPLEDGERGVIVNTASIAAFDGQIGQAAYAASKGGIVALALPAARELARHGIRVATVAPGIFRTPLLAELPVDVQASLAASIPFPARLGDPEEFAATVRHIIETRYLNAEVIRLDGGVRMPPK